MPSIEKFKEAENKAAYLIQEEIDTAFYGQLSALAKKEREDLAKEIICLRDSNFPQLIKKLSKLCFGAKGEAFVRGGAGDFLGNILAELVAQAELQKEKNEQFAVLFLENKQPSYPQSYVFDDEVSYIFSLIYEVAEDYPTSYKENLASNLANKTLNPLVIEKIYAENRDLELQALNKNREKHLNTQRALQEAVKNSSKLTSYFEQRLQTAPKSLEMYYKEEKSISPQRYENGLEAIKTHIKTSTWDLGGIGFLRGGVNIQIDNKSIRVPHRVAEIYKLIDAFEKKVDQNEQDKYVLYNGIQKLSREALDNPRTGQKESTRTFYRDILHDSYVAADRLEKKLTEDESASLIK
ncbi:hypothetical protein [Legionella hackeliae]|uniref:Uncharacterized protein n=1 Tax=Legionella hackeliae TaxID=449 RepID=A0A0A8UW68_LEGHA|nr:hypothetical protein [Legionella hackeliae]KTD09923.1 hypothetical protein Lhac_2291 [Legionella hackeliae]CEK11776.1 protein of unknown function [Legionella hackeliae]STX48547.1 Uncharacterised protein [Legionella hackeliae]